MGCTGNHPGLAGGACTVMHVWASRTCVDRMHGCCLPLLACPSFPEQAQQAQDLARKPLRSKLPPLLGLSSRVGPEFSAAVAVCPPVLCPWWSWAWNGHIGLEIAATLSSTGTRHVCSPGEASHGDR
jgi:hypothetical protein